MTEHQGRALLTILKCWTGVFVLAVVAGLSLQLEFGAGAFLAAVASLVVLLIALTTTGGADRTAPPPANPKGRPWLPNPSTGGAPDDAQPR